jgi:hypothetical protein
MSIVVHLARKDWERVRSSLIAWYALIAGKAWCVWQLMRSTDSSASDLEILGGFVGMMNGLEAVAGAFLAARLAFEDSPHETQAFWRTRPVARGYLLRAKLSGAVVLLLAVPVCLLTPVWLAAGFSVVELFTAAADWMLLQGLWVAFGLLAGALTRNPGQALLAASVVGLALLGIAVGLKQGPTQPVWLMVSLNLAVAVGGIALAYLSGRRRGGLGFVLLGFGGVALLGVPATPETAVLSVWPESERAMRVGETRVAGAHGWSLLKIDYDDRSFPVLLVQSARPLPPLLSPLPARAFSHLVSIDAPDSRQERRYLRPSHLGTVRAASLCVTRWQLSLPEDFDVIGADPCLFAIPRFNP